MTRYRSLAAAVLLAVGIANPARPDSSGLFTPALDVPLGPRADRTDYESIDPAAHRLYIANMGGGQVLVFDLVQNKLTSRLEGYPKVTGVLAVPEIHRLYASVPGAGAMASVFVGLGMVGLSSGKGLIAILDTQTPRWIGWRPGGVFPDGIAYDPHDRRVFVSDELGGAVIAIDAGNDQEIGRVTTKGEVGNVRYDAVAGKVYVPVQSHNELISIDPVKLDVLERRAMDGCDHPHGFIVMPGKAIGFVACDGNDRLLSVDLATGKTTDNGPVAHDPDVLALDPGLNRLYVASESGNLSTFDIADPAKPRSLGDTFVGTGAHSVAVDEETHVLYFALTDFGGQMVLRELSPIRPPAKVVRSRPKPRPLPQP
jgi:DNA-binding beta-propeller fold protein YncE